MAYLVSGTDLTSVANAIRTAGGTSAQLSFPTGFVTAIGNLSGGGGASNIVTGTFTGQSTDKGNAKNISLSYTGSGYPVAGFIYPTAGANSGGLESLAKKYAVYMFMFTKNDTTDTPTYSGNTAENKAAAISFYKFSDSDPTSTIANRDNNALILYNSNASSSTISCVKLKSATELSVYFADSTTYGFPDGIEFEYMILYSS